MKNFKEHLITETERQKIIEQMIEDMWDDELAYPTSIGELSAKFEKKFFFKKQYEEWEPAISKNGIVFDFENYDISVYTLMYCFSENNDPSKDKFSIDYLHYCRVNNDYIQLEHDETYLDLKSIITGDLSKYFDSRERKVGRPKRPADKSILLTHEVLSYLDENKDISIVDACKKFNIPRVSFYRAYKWIKDRSVIYENTEY
jgi:hypothetical protein